MGFRIILGLGYQIEKKIIMVHILTWVSKIKQTYK